MPLLTGLLLLLYWWGGSHAFAGWRPSQVTNRKQIKVQKLALLIGVGRFADKRWPTLQYTSNDLNKMTHALRTMGGFQVESLLTPAQTRKASILRGLKRLGGKLKSSQDTVVIYISTHGVVAPSPRGQPVRYIITSDTKGNIPATGLPVSAIQAVIRKFRSKRIVLMLATCYTGLPSSKSVMLPGVKQAPGSLRPGNRFQAHPAMQILSAASYAQPAFESQRLRSDVYTHFFVSCMSSLKQRNGAVTAIEAHVCASALTTQYVRKHRGAIQVPTAYSELGYNRDIYLVGHSKRARGMLHLRGFFGQRTRVLLRPLWGKKGPSPLSGMTLHPKRHNQVALLPGRYKLLRLSTSGQRLAEHDISIRAGQTTTLFRSDWALSLDARWHQAPFAGPSGLFGGALGLRHRYFALSLGLAGSSLSFSSSPDAVQLLLDLSVEGGYQHRWSFFRLFGGAYVSTALLMQDVNVAPSAGLVFGYGATISAVFDVHQQISLVLTGRLGFWVYLQESQIQHSLSGALSMGLLYRI